jgi:hypothetical protein
VQVGLLGYWREPAELGWQAARGTTSFFAHGWVSIEQVLERTAELIAAGPAR